MNPKAYFTLSGAIFLLVAVAHLVRLLQGWEVSIGDMHPPMWASILGLLVGGYLSFEGYRLSKK